MRRITVPPRPDWREKANAVGFSFHEMHGEPYWVDDAAYCFGLEEIERNIEEPSQILHDMCMDLVADIVNNEEALTRLAIPRDYHDVIRNSWLRGDLHLYGRFDLAYDGHGPAKLLEYNADTPTSVFETGYFQYNWLTDQVALGTLPAQTDQFNSVQEALIEAFGQFSRDRIFHFAAVSDSAEDCGTTIYLMDCAIQAGHRAQFLDIRDIGIDASGRYADLQSRVIERCFKLYPWEFMLRESFAENLRAESGIFIEPAWKAVLTNKGLLPMLWQRHPNHPNLLPSFFPDDAEIYELQDYVVKPLLSREGENISLYRNRREILSAPGSYGKEGYVFQAYAPLFKSEFGYAVLGSWIVGDRSCGLGIREDASPITANLSRYVPHIIEE